MANSFNPFQYSGVAMADLSSYIVALKRGVPTSKTPDLLRLIREIPTAEIGAGDADIGLVVRLNVDYLNDLRTSIQPLATVEDDCSLKLLRA